MTHSVRTTHGDYMRTYTQLPNEPRLSGETQGKGDVASVWSALSHTMLRAHQELHSGITLEHVNQEYMIRKNNDSFVDDTDAEAAEPGTAFQSNPESPWTVTKENDHFVVFPVAPPRPCCAHTRQSKRPLCAQIVHSRICDNLLSSLFIYLFTFLESTHNTLRHLQHGTQYWADLIEASGGSIVFHRSHFQILSWGDDEWPLSLKQNAKFSISLYNSFGARTKITQLDSDHPNPGLGCLIAPSGQQDSEFTKKRSQLLPIALSINRTYIPLIMHGHFFTHASPLVLSQSH